MSKYQTEQRLLGSCLTILILGAAGCSHETAHERPERPNVILISIDTLRADHLGCYGYERPTSPNLDALAEEGVLFEQSVNTGGATLSVHISMLTSLYPRVHGIVTSGSPSQYARRLEDDRVTLAEQLHEEGYATAAFTGSGWVRGEFGFDQGFGHFDDGGGGFATILPKVDRWLSESRAEPFFLFVHTYDVHSVDGDGLPYDSPGNYNNLYCRDCPKEISGCPAGKCSSAFLAATDQRMRRGEIDVAEVFSEDDLKYMIALYDGGITYVDHELRLFFDRLKDLGIYDESLIVVTSDHGEEFLEHGQLLHRRNYEETALVPLIVKFPSSAGYKGRRIRSMAATVDVMPTILDALQIPVNDQAQGISLMPLIAEDPGHARSVHLFSYLASEQYKLRTRDWSLLYDVQTDESTELYRLSSDKDERHNVIGEYPEIRRELHEIMRAAVRRDDLLRQEHLENARIGDTAIELDPATVKQLESLGYLESPDPDPDP